MFWGQKRFGQQVDLENASTSPAALLRDFSGCAESTYNYLYVTILNGINV